MKTIKLTVNVSDELVEALADMARDDGTSLTEQLRLGVSAHKVFHDTRRRGGRVLLESRSGQRNEVIFAY